MPSVDIVRTSKIERTARVLQLEGLFDIPPSGESVERWSVDLPLEDQEWQIGLIVGPSGSGKSTIAGELFGNAVMGEMRWGKGSVIDAFPKGMGIREIAALLSSVGFSSPPSWMRPYSVLSTGEKFRVRVARALAQRNKLIVVDEFTSVVDRKVAQIGSAAVAKAVRKTEKQFVAVTCHYDVTEWLQPDWVFDPSSGRFQWRELQRRPTIRLDVRRASTSEWGLFRRHHYLTNSIAKSAQCFVAFLGSEPVAFAAVVPFPHAKRPGWREHRTVCLPDYQGVGIGNVLCEFVASMFKAKGRPYFSTLSHPGIIHRRVRSSTWALRRKPSLVSAPGKTSRYRSKALSLDRFTAGFEYVGPSNEDAARLLGVL